MQFTHLVLATHKLRELRSFYIDTFRLPVVEEDEESFTFDAGATRVTFRATEQVDSVYHFAFTIPRNKFEAAYAWISALTEPLMQNGQDRFLFGSWNNSSVYFYDPAGNNVEFIALHDLENDAPGAFEPARDLLRVSEIGLPVHSVPAEVEVLKRDFAQLAFRESEGPQFAAVGDLDGRLIVVEIGRAWYPTEVGAVVAPVTVRMRGPRQAQQQIEGLPYMLEQVSE
ncbi:VOC family protein [Ktedonobacter robiniae]|uniref:VOC domain-containing protein n=1 Tax=Ktedonobacter robiniae TaxID=2778365 RepID=A0ABQ3UZ86_9CHLR|nr:VOC family protein [Ktedonobacter robiniae]GHO57969.1 hypothetical protein KSB_64440 [Ktedonobacter robiniae]